MEILDFRKELGERVGIALDSKYVLFQDYELYNSETNESVNFKEFDELLDYKVEDKTIKEMIEEKKNVCEEDYGGRGAYSSSKRGGSLFSGKGARSAGRGSGESMKPLPPAYINSITGGRYKSLEKTSNEFGKKFLNEGREYAGVIDEQGFALDYTKGNKASVQHLERPGAWSIHNHPSKVLNAKAKNGTVYYNAPSGPDLRNWALGKGKGTIVVASGNRTRYTMTKSNNFKGKDFVKGMKGAKSTGYKNYDSDVDKWLKANQKKYGYKYSKKKF